MKSGGGAVTVKLTVVVWKVVGPSPRTVKIYVPGAVEAATARLRVELPAPFTLVGLNVPLTPAGSPLTLRATFPVKPLREPTLTV